jgi:hypothetical protein
VDHAPPRQARHHGFPELVFDDIDAFLCPANFTPAFPHDTRSFEERMITTPEGERPYDNQPFSISHASLPGLPAVVTPIGRTDRGLPVGAQIIGPLYEDDTALTFAELLGGVIGGYESPPNPEPCPRCNDHQALRPIFTFWTMSTSLTPDTVGRRKKAKWHRGLPEPGREDPCSVGDADRPVRRPNPTDAADRAGSADGCLTMVFIHHGSKYCCLHAPCVLRSSRGETNRPWARRPQAGPGTALPPPDLASGMRRAEDEG